MGSLGAWGFVSSRIPQEEDLFADSFDEWDTEDDEEDGRRYSENRAVRQRCTVDVGKIKSLLGADEGEGGVILTFLFSFS